MSRHIHTTYMGSYSLNTWIKKILKGNIIIPDFQRNFAWDEEQIKNLASSINNGFFIPPIILGKMEDKIYLLDGQQRLTSLLLIYLKRSKPEDNFNFSSFVKKIENEEEIKISDLDKLRSAWDSKWPSATKKEERDLDLSPSSTDSLLYHSFIPYCLICSEGEKQKNFFAQLFCDINFLQRSLSNQDLFRAIAKLNHFNRDILNFDLFIEFEGIMNGNKGGDDEKQERTFLSPYGKEKDFIEHLALLVEYETNQDNSDFYPRRTEKKTQQEMLYVKNFLLSFNDNEGSEIPIKWSKKILENFILDEEKERRFKESMKIFFNFIDSKNKERKEMSGDKRRNIAYQDFYIFGFLYFVYFSKEDVKSLTFYLDKIDQSAEKYKEEMLKEKRYKNSPNKAEFLRKRLKNVREIILEG